MMLADAAHGSPNHAQRDVEYGPHDRIGLIETAPGAPLPSAALGKPAVQPGCNRRQSEDAVKNHAPATPARRFTSGFGGSKHGSCAATKPSEYQHGPERS